MSAMNMAKKGEHDRLEIWIEVSCHYEKDDYLETPSDSLMRTWLIRPFGAVANFDFFFIRSGKLS